MRRKQRNPDKRTESIQQRINGFKHRLKNAERYLERGVNVEGSAWLHFDDWGGNSGHPDWVKHKLIPTTRWEISKSEKTLEDLQYKEKDRRITERKGRKNDDAVSL